MFQKQMHNVQSPGSLPPGEGWGEGLLLSKMIQLRAWEHVAQVTEIRAGLVRRTPSIRSTETTISEVERELVFWTSPSPRPSPGGRGRLSRVTWPCIPFDGCTVCWLLRPFGVSVECPGAFETTRSERVRLVLRSFAPTPAATLSHGMTGGCSWARDEERFARSVL
jgi:hypothetical protein